MTARPSRPTSLRLPAHVRDRFAAIAAAQGTTPHAEMVAALTEFAQTARICLRCGTDLSRAMGVYVYIGSRHVPGLLCITCGANGRNSMTRAAYEALIEGTHEGMQS